MNVRGLEAYPRMEVFSRVEASFDREWVEYIGTDLCRILEEIEKLGVEITFKKGQHVVCGTFKQIQYIEEHLCHGTSSGRQSRDSWPVGGRAFESLPVQHSSSFYPGNRSEVAESSFEKGSQQNYGTAGFRAHHSAQAPYIVNQESERWGGGGVGHLGGLSSSNVGADYGSRSNVPTDGMYYGNVPSDYPNESVDRYTTNRDKSRKEDASGEQRGKILECEIKRGVNDLSSNVELKKNMGNQLTSGIKEEKQAIRADESKSTADSKKDGEVPQEVDGLSQELMVDKDIWEYFEVKMAAQWSDIQQFGAKIDKIVDESGMVRLRIAPSADTDDSDSVGLVYDSLAGLYNDVQSRIIMEVLNVRPSPETEPILAMVMQYVIERYPLVYLKCCPQRDHYYFIGPLHEVHVAFRMFELAYRTAVENEIIRIQQLSDKLHHLELQVSRKLIVDRNAAQGASAARDSFGASAAFAADSGKEDRYEGMATGGGNPAGWGAYEVDQYGDIPYRGDDYTRERGERDANGRGNEWCDPLIDKIDTSEQDGRRAQGIESYIVITRVGDPGYYDDDQEPWKSSTGGGRNKTERVEEEETSFTSKQKPQSVIDGKSEPVVLTKKKSDFGHAEMQQVDESSKWGLIRMKSESPSKPESFDALKNLNNDAEEAADRDYTVSSLSRLEVPSPKVNADNEHSLPEKDEKINLKKWPDDVSKIERKEIRSSVDSDDADEDEK